MLLTEFLHQLQHHPSDVHLSGHSQGDITVQVRDMDAQFPRSVRVAAIWHPYPVQSHGSFLRARRKWLSSASLPQRKTNPTDSAAPAAAREKAEEPRLRAHTRRRRGAGEAAPKVPGLRPQRPPSGLGRLHLPPLRPGPPVRVPARVTAPRPPRPAPPAAPLTVLLSSGSRGNRRGRRRPRRCSEGSEASRRR